VQSEERRSCPSKVPLSLAAKEHNSTLCILAGSAPEKYDAAAICPCGYPADAAASPRVCSHPYSDPTRFMMHVHVHLDAVERKTLIQGRKVTDLTLKHNKRKRAIQSQQTIITTQLPAKGR